ncbi:MAG TPA: 5'-nucleotidase C-terminal domain-containing protein [bacterium]|nr:5'-nucleotidase C-terminal domain-containing protein [bacterium]HQN74363.1 5'-nucleotidase C-terminal domain-containing protein [bacterium]
MRKVILISALMIISSFPLFGEPKLLTILFTNDSHGMAWSFDEPESPKTGGLAAQKTLVDNIRNEVQLNNGDVVVLSSGNVTMGDPRSNVCENLPMIMGMNLIGYDGMLVGSHEFDFGMKTFEKMQKEARFPFMSANLFFKNGKQVGKSYIEKELINGVKVAFLGITTPELEKISNAGVDGLVKVKDPVETAKKLAAELKQKNDFVIVLSNLGYSDSDISSDGYPSDSKLAKEVKGIDLIIGGRTKIQMEKPVMVNNIPIVQTEGLGKWVGRYDFYFEGKELVKTEFKLYPVNVKKKVVEGGQTTYENIGRGLKENDAMIKMLNDFNCEFSTQIIGELEKPFCGKRSTVRFNESDLGNFIADVMKERASTEIAFINGGSLRQGLNSGIINEMDVYSVFPFEDTIVTGELAGSELRDMIYISAGKFGAGGFLHFSGVSIKRVDGSVTEITVNGKPIDVNGKYTFAANSFITGGGDGFEMFKKINGLNNTGLSVPAVIIEHIKKEKYIQPPIVKGRIK